MSNRRLLPGVAAITLIFYLGARLDRAPGSAAPRGPFPGAAAQESPARARPSFLGRVEPVGGEVSLGTRVTGVLEQVSVEEGDTVEAGAELARLLARREKAQVEVARANLNVAQARLDEVVAGAGAEEKAALLARRRSAEARLTFSRLELDRLRKLEAAGSEREEAVDRATHQVAALEEEVTALAKEYEALLRGALPRTLDVARAQVALAAAELRAAEAALEETIVRAPFKGTVLALDRHAGDLCIVEVGTTILRLADVSRLRVRVELPEGFVGRVSPGILGTLEPVGWSASPGEVEIERLLPSFGPRRLFEPDTSVRADVRTLQALCRITRPFDGLTSGQRVTVRLN